MTSTQITHETTRKRLLEAAGQVFAQHGFEKATVREICRKANANVASVNYHFGGKEDLYAEVVAYGAQQSVEAFPPDRGLGPNPLPEAELNAFIHSFLCRFLKKNQRGSWYSTLCAREIVLPTRALDRVVREVIRPLSDRLEAIVRRLVPRASKLEVGRCARSIVGQCLFYHHGRPVIERMGGPKKYADADIRRLADHIARFSLQGLRGWKGRAA
ncbi:MAG: TetR family transcriptional regulator [Candidatus Omnitrophica bacterium CG11_big_fil_rev_8_21_14_0_20_64_10]|nr:MAG: TetR family transcriptional regulator [Candidatus Omnitrophica bacterium CG11_big_fil_rev_8_21_14_0_20_64_10]